MTQLILSIVVMYLVVGSCSYWSLRKRRDLHETTLAAEHQSTSNKLTIHKAIIRQTTTDR